MDKTTTNAIEILKARYLTTPERIRSYKVELKREQKRAMRRKRR